MPCKADPLPTVEKGSFEDSTLARGRWGTAGYRYVVTSNYVCTGVLRFSGLDLTLGGYNGLVMTKVSLASLQQTLFPCKIHHGRFGPDHPDIANFARREESPPKGARVITAVTRRRALIATHDDAKDCLHLTAFPRTCSSGPLHIPSLL